VQRRQRAARQGEAMASSARGGAEGSTARAKAEAALRGPRQHGPGAGQLTRFDPRDG
jgi:hypothetical protein